MDIHSIRENGFLVLDKPEGLTSHEAVQLVRRRLRMRRVGHLGTLDPLATGVLPMAVGKATRLVQFLKNSEKIYEGTICIGTTTDTYDREGRVLSRTSVPDVPAQLLQILAAQFLGPQLQVPPPYSAKKIGGVPAYRLARKGKPVEIAAQRISVYQLELSLRSAEEIDFYVRCSAGTYVRTLASDLGKQLGCGAYLGRLRRRASGEFTLSHAIDSEILAVADVDFLAERLIPMSAVLKSLPLLEVDAKTKESLAHGGSFVWSAPQEISKTPLLFRVFFDGEMIGLVEPRVEAVGELFAEPTQLRFQPRVVLI
jgi:tRNA pseudouridine55 synthase